ncbi:DUF4297 domain-containing protein [Pseudoalteromonas sp. NSLLW24]|uniref:dsDNA nuclease domain-containing protein n=1 Tax=Pseudoalteromonas sp. NSLLW24 TaxID=2792050 RepID=UPI0018CEA6A1|nr:dsDNA nuclease domain-containing protein [Pseudoalteromonas sp. NSLLW24]MBG9999299.1 DUF4297 domain-containing protein [Pseudoalteromonas sp. NSLLW24]
MSASEMELSDSGGPAALKGFIYQNFVAAYYALRMLENKNLLSVRCEAVDDVDAVYTDKIEYIQIKTTEKDRKWSVSEFADADTKVVPPVKGQRKEQTVSKEDSILHKSILCDKGKHPSYFRIVTPRDVTDSLKYLKTSLNTRNEKAILKPPLLKRLGACIERNRPKKSPLFTSPNGNDIEYWLDHAEWEVIPQEVIESRCTKLIQQAAQRKGIYLFENGDPERILCSLLNNLFKKGAASRVIKSIDDKSYLREDFIPWFESEIEHYANLSEGHVKIYTTDGKTLQVVLSLFFQDNNLYEEQEYSGRKECKGLKGEYHRRQYGYDLIARNLYKWFHEILLLPNEIADNAPGKITDKFKLLTQRYKQEANFINNLIAKALLHSTIRTIYKAQPIAANLHIDDNNNTCFDNIHIILNAHHPDNLLMGFSRLIDKIDDSSIANIVHEFNSLLDSEAFSTQKEKVLIAKKDNYLLDHDIDDILNANSSLDTNLDRFRFVFFIGYQSDHLKCNAREMTIDYEKSLELEVTTKFKSLVDKMLLKDEFYEDLHIEVYLYPIPSLSSLINEIQTQVKSQWKPA